MNEPLRRHGWIPAAVLALVTLGGTGVHAAGWRIDPALDTAAHLTDNINHGHGGDADADAILEVTPSVRAIRNHGRLRASALYRLQTLGHLNDTDRSKLNHQLGGRGTFEAVRNALFLDADATVRQVADDLVSQGSDDISGGGVSNVATFGAGPRWRMRFKGLADGEASYYVQSFHTDSENASDSLIQRINFGLDSGPDFGRVFWNANYLERLDDRSGDNTDDQDIRRYSGTLGYRFFRTLSGFVTSGKEDSDITTSGDDVNNGSYQVVGANWTPNRYFSLTGSEGDNTHLEATVTPSSRTNLVLGWTDTSVGTNVGEVWNMLFRHRSRFNTWIARYQEDTSTYQQLASALALMTVEQAVALLDSGALPGDTPVLFDPVTGLVILPVPTLTDEAIETRSLTASVARSRGPNTTHLGLFSINRTFLSSREEEQNNGITGSYERRLRGNLSARFTLLASHVDPSNPADEDQDLWRGEAALIWNLGRRSTAALRYRHIDSASDDADQDYTENRISAEYGIRF